MNLNDESSDEHEIALLPDAYQKLSPTPTSQLVVGQIALRRVCRQLLDHAQLVHALVPGFDQIR